MPTVQAAGERFLPLAVAAFPGSLTVLGLWAGSLAAGATVARAWPRR